MSEFTGQARQMLDLLGLDRNDPALEALFALTGPGEATTPKRRNGAEYFAIRMPERGIDLNFKIGSLLKVIVRTRAERAHGYAAYPDPAALIDGLDTADASREQVRARFGEPGRTDPYWDMWPVGDRWITVRYVLDMNRDHLSVLSRITPMLAAC